jgi:hypothetical protein
MKIIERFGPRQLRDLCKRYGGGPKNYEIDSWDGSQKKIKLVDDDFVNYARMHISIDQVKAFAAQKRIDISDLLREEKELEKQRKIRNAGPKKAHTDISILSQLSKRLNNSNRRGSTKTNMDTITNFRDGSKPLFRMR